jgi:PLP dependent protein
MYEENLARIQGRICAACERAGRRPDEVTLVAVSKTHPPESVDAMAALGVLDFGENKVQEAKAKAPLCRGNLRWHGIGHLQSNKVRDAVRIFHMLHSVDSLRIAAEVSRHAVQQAKHIPILLEVNVSGEKSKFGLPPEELIEVALEVNKLSHLELKGFMTMAPFSDDPEKARPYFRQLRELKKRVEDALGAPLPDLSMGMSGDFEVGIEEGATLVRVGTSLFGERRAKAPRADFQD